MSLAESHKPAPPMKVEEFLDLPDDGVERDLIDGVVREWIVGPPERELTEADMTRRNPLRCEAETSIGYELRL